MDNLEKRTEQKDGRLWHLEIEVGESPYWDHTSNSLFFIDIRAPSLNQVSGDGQIMNRWPLPEPVGAFALLQHGNHAVIGLKNGLALLDLTTCDLTRLVNPEPDLPTNRINEGKVSPCGNWFLFGTMDESGDHRPTGAFYALSGTGALHQIADGLVIANGLAWSLDGSKLYFSDSWSSIIWAADWNAETGILNRKQVFVRPDATQGMPDGAAMDREGNYWSAAVSTGRLNCFAPSGALVDWLQLPMQAPTMPAIGGRDNQTLFVTSHRRITTPRTSDGAIFVRQSPAMGVNIPCFSAAPDVLIKALCDF
ncbi:SMP-30/gluconolactonase/LRE family protein [Cognatishimia sp.]|uniref:SMP-30/gluconolactonase/LRE family protein n=1 Tax=Cognatishimia sp. TaxID=2211648 RepID=UPI003516E812|nr:SMP-30/gluconolactonase/LRE family protein [Cognatishimia sp.]